MDSMRGGFSGENTFVIRMSRNDTLIFVAWGARNYLSGIPLSLGTAGLSDTAC